MTILLIDDSPQVREVIRLCSRHHETKAPMGRWRQFCAVAVTLLAFALLTRPAAACTTGFTFPRISLPGGSRVLVAHVTGYGESSLVGCFAEDSWPTLIISVDIEFEGTALEGQKLELIPYALSASCGNIPLTKAQMESRFPLDARLRVLGETTNPCHEVSPKKKDELGSKVFASLFSGHVATVGPNDPDPSLPWGDASASVARAPRLEPRNAMDFEAIKALIRLSRSQTTASKRSGLRRLLSFPEYRNSAVCRLLVAGNVPNQQDRLPLLEMCDRETTSGP
jgi:hypothetical protein